MTQNTNAPQHENQLNEQTKRLAAISAAAAVNCRPCLEHHVPMGTAMGLSEREIREAIEIGLTVNRGAHSKTTAYIDDVIANSKTVNPGQKCCDADASARTGCC